MLVCSFRLLFCLLYACIIGRRLSPHSSSWSKRPASRASFTLLIRLRIWKSFLEPGLPLLVTFPSIIIIFHHGLSPKHKDHNHDQQQSAQAQHFDRNSFGCCGLRLHCLGFRCSCLEIILSLLRFCRTFFGVLSLFPCCLFYFASLLSLFLFLLPLLSVPFFYKSLLLLLLSLLVLFVVGEVSAVGLHLSSRFGKTLRNSTVCFFKFWNSSLKTFALSSQLLDGLAISFLQLVNSRLNLSILILEPLVFLP